MTIAHTFDFRGDRIGFLLERRSRRTLEIAVKPDGSVVVVAPESASLEDIIRRVEKRGWWVSTQQRYFSQFEPRTPSRRYVPGETHLYLGRQYRIKMVGGSSERVRMSRGFIEIAGLSADNQIAIERAVTAWYRERAMYQFHQRLMLSLARFSSQRSLDRTGFEFRLKRMKTKWGSMSPSGLMTLNPDLIRAPVESIDYVITHELCHVLQPNHTPAFYELLDQTMPDWRDRKLRLERMLA